MSEPTEPFGASGAERPLRALCIDDEPDHVELLRIALAGLERPRVVLSHASSARAGCEAVEASDPDLVFIDYRLPDGTAEDVLARLRERGHEPPSIVLTAHGDEYLATRLAHAGADAYLGKRDLTAHRLAATVEMALERWRVRCRERWERKRAAALAHLATSLTGGEADALREGWEMDPDTGLLTAEAWNRASAAAHRPYARAGYACGVLLAQLAEDRGADGAGARLDRVLSVLRPIDVPGWHAPPTRLAVYAPDAGLFTLDPLARELRSALCGPRGTGDVRVGGAASHGGSLDAITARAEAALAATRLDRPILVVRGDEP